MSKLLDYLGTCSTPYCGGIYGYFCVKCNRYTSECICHANDKLCSCVGFEQGKWWAGTGERQWLREKLAEYQKGGHESTFTI